MIDENRGVTTSEAAESLAAELFAWMAGEPDVLSRFMAASGLNGASIRAAASDPGFLVGVLDFAVGDDAIVVAFAHHAGIPPDRIAAAWTALTMPPPARKPAR